MLSARVERQLGTMTFTDLAGNSVCKRHMWTAALLVYPVIVS